MRLRRLVNLVWILILVPIVLSAQTRSPNRLSAGEILGAVNPQCVAYTIVGACPVIPLVATHVLVEYWDPVIMIETTPRTGESAISGDFFDEVTGIIGLGQDVMTRIAESASELEAGGPGRVANIAGNGNLWFREARVLNIAPFGRPLKHPSFDQGPDRCPLN